MMSEGMMEEEAAENGRPDWIYRPKKRRYVGTYKSANDYHVNGNLNNVEKSSANKRQKDLKKAGLNLGDHPEKMEDDENVLKKDLDQDKGGSMEVNMLDKPVDMPEKPVDISDQAFRNDEGGPQKVEKFGSCEVGIQDEDFFLLGDMERGLYLKYIPVASQKGQQGEALMPFLEPTIRCSYGRCDRKFYGISQYEEHYNSAHRNVCHSCGRIFPTLRLLDLHILETHDSFFKILSEKQNMYECLVEGCGQKFQDASKRRMHLIGRHKYPKTFNFQMLGLPPNPPHFQGQKKGNFNNLAQRTFPNGRPGNFKSKDLKPEKRQNNRQKKEGEDNNNKQANQANPPAIKPEIDLTGNDAAMKIQDPSRIGIKDQSALKSAKEKNLEKQFKKKEGNFNKHEKPVPGVETGGVPTVISFGRRNKGFHREDDAPQKTFYLKSNQEQSKTTPPIDSNEMEM